MSGERRVIEVRRVVRAPASSIFAFLARADNHVKLDTSGMIQSSADHAIIEGVGDVFVMNMHNTMRGDHQVVNHVVVFEPGRAIGWAPSEPGQRPAGHTFVWYPEPQAGNRTVVRQVHDWSAFTHHEHFSELPVVDAGGLRHSIDLLADEIETG